MSGLKISVEGRSEFAVTHLAVVLGVKNRVNILGLTKEQRQLFFFCLMTQYVVGLILYL